MATTLKRKYISSKQRVAVAERQGFRCFYCPRQFVREKVVNPQGYLWVAERGKLAFHFDHRIPLTKGGADDVSNLVFCCSGCNLSKSKKIL